MPPHPDALEAMRRHAEACAPEECVGALFGDSDAALIAFPLQNSSPTPARAFELTAAEYLRAEREAAARGLRLLGFFHSHVDTADVPSAADLKQVAHFSVGVLIPVKSGKAGPPVVFHPGC